MPRRLPNMPGMPFLSGRRVLGAGSPAPRPTPSSAAARLLLWGFGLPSPPGPGLITLRTPDQAILSRTRSAPRRRSGKPSRGPRQYGRTNITIDDLDDSFRAARFPRRPRRPPPAIYAEGCARRNRSKLALLCIFARRRCSFCTPPSLQRVAFSGTRTASVATARRASAGDPPASVRRDGPRQ